MSGFVLHPEAFADLGEICEFIAADNLSAADKVLEESMRRLAILSLSLNWATSVSILLPGRAVSSPYAIS
jgi:plasmid stabilization system protein ParE